MHKNTLWYIALLLVVYLTYTFCEESETAETQIPKNANPLSDTKELLEVEGRTRRRHGFHHLHHLWGWHALAIAYWIKVKVVIVSFLLGSAIFLGLRYYWPHKCTPEIVYDHPPHGYSSDHIPYSLDHSDHAEHSFDSSSFEPYSGYSSYSSGSDVVSSDTVLPTGPSDIHRLGRRSVKNDEETQPLEEGRQVKAEEQIADVMFTFLGLDSMSCRRRFVCEMEFRSMSNPLTSMAFRIVGRGFFEKYTNARNPLAHATSFNNCAAVNPECIFIEQNEEHSDDSQNKPEAQDSSDNNELPEIEIDENNINTVEAQNEQNLRAERRRENVLRYRSGDRKLDTVAEHIMTIVQ